MVDKLTNSDLIYRVVYVNVNGIPAIAKIETYYKAKPNRKADNPYDYYGYTELEFTMYDREGYRAHWLEKIIDNNEKLEDNIREQILKDIEKEEKI